MKENKVESTIWLGVLVGDRCTGVRAPRLGRFSHGVLESHKVELDYF